MHRTKKALKYCSIIILLIAAFSLFSYSVSYVAKGGKKLGALTEPINSFASFPGTVLAVLTSSELKGIPPTYIEKDPSLEEVNKLRYDLYGLNSTYNPEKDVWEIKLVNFKNDSLIYKWQLKKEYYKQDDRQYENSEPRNPFILPDTSLIVANDESNNLFRLDKNSNVIWHNTSRKFHHALNPAADGNIWVCTRASRGIRDYADETRLYRDDYITKVSAQTGEILFDKSVAEILIENGYKNFVYGSNNQISYTEADQDPLHLNDIQPALEDSPYWKKGDVFISLRNKSLVFLYRPETNEVIHLLYGPFLNQHDVDILSDKEISFFNNNIAQIGSRELGEIENELGTAKHIDTTQSSSDITIYNFEDSTYRTHLKHHFENENIFTFTQGFQEQLSTGDVYVEDQNNGKIYIINDQEVVLRKAIGTSMDNMVERPHWIRIYETLNF